MDLASITYNGWCAIKPNQTKPSQAIIICALVSRQKLFVWKVNYTKKSIFLSLENRTSSNLYFVFNLEIVF